LKDARGEQCAHPLPDGRVKQPADARAPFVAAQGLGPAEIVEAGAGMGVDNAERGGLLAQMHQHAHEHGVLDDIGEVAGVEGMAIVHAGGRVLGKCSARVNFTQQSCEISHGLTVRRHGRVSIKFYGCP
jgi:hypothetical protein